MHACKGPEPKPVDFGYDYFPLEVGQIRHYEVDSIFYSEWNVDQPIDTFHYSIIEQIVDTFQNAGNVNYIIERSTFLNNELVTDNTFRFFLSIHENSVEEVTNNVRRVKLTYPVRLFSQWDMNAFNTMEKQNAEITAINSSDDNGFMLFDSAATVVYYNDTTNFVFNQMLIEKYARGYGRYYREYLIKETQLGKDSGVYVIEKLSKIE